MAFNLSRRPNVKVGITMKSLCDAAKKNRVELATIRAVDETESAGSGFLTSSQRPKILFEGHYFYKFLKRLGLHKKGAEMEPSICYPAWTKRYYIGREGEYSRLAKATELCHRLGISDEWALRSTSWGRYQIMGDNYEDAGYDSVQDFVEAMFLDESEHLSSFFTYLNNSSLIDELQRLPSNPARFAMLFAAGYNGSGYRRNKYDIKIINSRAKFLRKPFDCSKISDTIEVVEAMPGIREADPAQMGFANTSLDDRYTEGGDEVSVVGITNEASAAAPETPLGDPAQQSGKENIVIEKEEKVKLWDYMKIKLGALFGGNVTMTKLVEYSGQYQSLGISEKFQTWLIIASAVVSFIAIIVWVISWWTTEKAKEKRTDQMVAENSIEGNLVHFATTEQLPEWQKWGAIVVRR